MGVRRHPFVRNGVVLGALAGVLALAGCGGEAQGKAAAANPTLVYPNALTVCSDVPYKPFEFVRAGVTVGFDVDIAQTVADELEVRLDIVDVSFEEITSGSALNAGTCDMAISSITITGDRARVVDFSSQYFEAHQVLMAPAGSGIEGLSDAAGKRIFVQNGTTGASYLRQHAPLGTKITFVGDFEVAKAAAQRGDADAIVADNMVAASVTKQSGFKAVEAFTGGEQYGIAVKKDGNAELLRVINRVMAEIREDGRYDSIYETWFGK